MLVIFGVDWKKKKKKREILGFEPTPIFIQCFLRYTLSPVGHRGVLFQCEEEPFDISLLNLCDKTWSNVNKSSRVYGQNLMIFCTFSSFLITNSQRLCWQHISANITGVLTKMCEVLIHFATIYGDLEKKCTSCTNTIIVCPVNRKSS